MNDLTNNIDKHVDFQSFVAGRYVSTDNSIYFPSNVLNDVRSSAKKSKQIFRETRERDEQAEFSFLENLIVNEARGSSICRSIDDRFTRIFLFTGEDK